MNPLDTSLPPLYAKWVQGLLDALPPPETQATCHDCAMCKPEQTAYLFVRDTKCCVYLPALPNFLVGRILNDEAAPGRDSVVARIDARIAVTPLGLGRPPAYDVPHTKSINVLGRSDSLVCPHYLADEGLCGIHDHRDHTCATWFCKHERGQTGARFWNTVRHLLEAIEQELGKWCALELEVDATAMATLISTELSPPQPDGDALDGRVPDATYNAFWGTWLGREVEFYKACAEKVDALEWADVERICGPRVHVLARLTQTSHDRLTSQELPDPLRIGAFNTRAMGAQGSLVVTHSATDPIHLPSLLLSVLHYFDGRPTQEVLQQMADERGITLDEPLMRQLVDWGVLNAG